MTKDIEAPPDGAGKTSVLRLVGHTTFPTTGTVEVLGHRLGRVDVRELRQGGEQAAGGHGRILPVNPDTGWQLGDLASALRTRRRTEREPVVPITVPSTELAVFELRQYTLRPGRREELIELFDREFVESQEECGAAVVGQFRDLDDPDRFVWRRGFRDIAVRHEALAAFYGGPVWAEHGPAANATVADSDDVLLLRPLVEGGGPAVEPSWRPRAGSPAPDRFPGSGPVRLRSRLVLPAGREEGPALVRDGFLPPLGETGPAPLAALTTETARNTFARLPVRTGENVAAVLTSYPDEAAQAEHLAALRDHPLAREEILPALARERIAPPSLCV